MFDVQKPMDIGAYILQDDSEWSDLCNELGDLAKREYSTAQTKMQSRWQFASTLEDFIEMEEELNRVRYRKIPFSKGFWRTR